MRAFLPLLIVVCLCLTGASKEYSTVTLRYFSVELAGNAFDVSWEAQEEEDVQRYELYRKTSFATEFSQIATRTPHGANIAYRFQDDQVYKSGMDQVDYRLEVVYSSGVRQQLAEKKVNYTPTAIRRSWGSIKAMFQF